MFKNEYQQEPHMGATFYPGGNDGFSMPELVSPTPQRIMPEVPSNMQEGLAHLELESRSQPVHRDSALQTAQAPYLDPHRPQAHSRDSQVQSSGPPRQSERGFTASYEHTNASAYQNISREPPGGLRREPRSPKLSPFPKLRDPGPNVPLSDEEKEEVLEKAMQLVLSSTDPEMQLAWAQDALAWVEVAGQVHVWQQAEGQTRSKTPTIEQQLRDNAISIVDFLAKQNHPKAEFIKAMWLEFGKFGYPMDQKEAHLGFRRAADKGYARALYRLGMQYESLNNIGQALEHYDQGVILRDSASQYRVGMMILLGQHGMPQDYQRGVDLVRSAAETADENAPQGAYVYGMLLARDLPKIPIPDQYLPYDLNEAKMFIEKAAYLGFAKAQLKMAQAYELCQLGCEFEPTLSLHYNALAAHQGEAEADMGISKWFLCGYEGVFEKNEQLAFTYAKRAALTRLPTAEFAVGYFYEVGVSVPIDLRESESWYQKAADHGNKDAVARIQSIHENKTLSKKDHEQVAISRIKSQYGSQRGKRPDRLKQRPAQLPIMSEERTDMPDPRHSMVSPGQGQLRPDSKLSSPGRPLSAAPYPEDDMATLTAANSLSSLSPHYGPGLRPSRGSGPPSDRPSSAFGIRPLSHASTESYGHGRTPSEQLRPSTSMGNMGGPTSQGNNPGGRDRMSTGWEPQVPTHRQPSPSRQPTVPQIDFGPPLNTEHAGNRLQKPPAPSINKPQAPNQMQIQNQGYGSDASRRPPSQSGYDGRPMDPSVQRRDPAANQLQRPERGSSMNPAAPAKNSQGQDRVGSLQNPNRASQHPTQGGPLPGPRSKVSSSAASAASKKTGPSTFEEMGIPAGKNESDCIIM